MWSLYGSLYKSLHKSRKKIKFFKQDIDARSQRIDKKLYTVLIDNHDRWEYWQALSIRTYSYAITTTARVRKAKECLYMQISEAEKAAEGWIRDGRQEF